MNGSFFDFSPYGGFLPLGGDEVLWSPTLSATRLSRVGSLHPLICEVDRRVRIGASFLTDEPAYMAAQLLQRQGYLVSASDPGDRPDGTGPWNRQVVVWESLAWNDFLGWSAPPGSDVTHVFLGAESEQCWVYRGRPGTDVCFQCLVRRWLANLRQGRALRCLVESGRKWRWQSSHSAENWAAWFDTTELEPGHYCWAPMTERQQLGAAVTTPECGCGPVRVAGGPSPLSLVAEVSLWAGSSPWVCATATLGEPGWLVRPPEGPAGQRGTGCHLDSEVSRRQAQGEAVERYCAGFLPFPRRGLRVEKKARPPRLFTDEQLAQPDFPYRLAGPGVWAETEELGSPRVKRWFPLEMVYFLDDQEGRELGSWGHLAPTLSHGLAAGRTAEAACHSAIWELIERDALVSFWVSWSRGLTVRARRWSALELQRLPQTGPLKLEMVEIEALVGRACLALLFDEAGRPACGSAAAADPLLAASKALSEAWQNHLYLQARGDEAPVTESQPRSYRDHALYYWHRPQLFPRWPLLDQPLESSQEAGLIETLRGKGFSLYWRDLTTADASQLGYRVVRVVAPGLLAPPQDHRHWTLGVPRWHQLFGDVSRPALPHPFA